MHERIPELGYVHFVEPRADPAKLANWNTYSAEHDVSESLQQYRDIFQGSKTQFLSAGGYTPELAREYVEEHGGAVVFGRWFISSKFSSFVFRLVADGRPRSSRAYQEEHPISQVRSVSKTSTP